MINTLEHIFYIQVNYFAKIYFRYFHHLFFGPLLLLHLIFFSSQLFRKILHICPIKYTLILHFYQLNCLVLHFDFHLIKFPLELSLHVQWNVNNSFNRKIIGCYWQCQSVTLTVKFKPQNFPVKIFPNFCKSLTNNAMFVLRISRSPLVLCVQRN